MPYKDQNLRKKTARKRYLRLREGLLQVEREKYQTDEVYREAVLEKNRSYRKREGKKYVARAVELQKKYRHANPLLWLKLGLRARLSKALAGTLKSSPTLELLGCPIAALQTHLESQFRPGMTWENYGPVWHVDHLEPCAKFDLSDPAQQRECFNFSNLQPLFAEENLRKAAK